MYNNAILLAHGDGTPGINLSVFYCAPGAANRRDYIIGIIEFKLSQMNVQHNYLVA